MDVVYLIHFFCYYFVVFNRYGAHRAAIETGKAKATKLFLEKEDAKELCKALFNMMPPLHTAIWGDSLEVLEILLDYGSDIELKYCWRQYAPLQLAVYLEKVEFVELLLRRGADVDAEIVSGDTALLTAANINAVEIARLLLKYGADPVKGAKYVTV